MDLPTAAAQARYEAFVRVAPDAVVGLDFDGTLAPIVDEPAEARLHPGVAPALRDLAAEVATVAIVTGRPVRQVVELGRLEELGDELEAQGQVLHVFGQYGLERWSSAERVVASVSPPPGVAALEDDLLRVIEECGAGGAYVEWKGLAVAVHTRQLDDPEQAWHRLAPALGTLAEAYDLVLEPGRHVLELRSGQSHKGDVLRGLVADAGASGCCFVGDDLADLEAFEAVAALSDGGSAGLCVCAGSAETSRLAQRADVVVDGPAGVVDFLRVLVEDVRAQRGRGH